MNGVFLDTVGLLALWDSSDQWHEPASAAFSEISQANSDLLTTTFVLLECANAAARRPYRDAVERLRTVLERANRLIVPSDEIWEQAWIAYRRGEADSAGVVDHVSFLVMRDLGIHRAFTNDRHFRAAGFETLF